MQSNKILNELFDWVEAAVFGVVTIVLIFTFLFRIVGIDGESMLPTFKDEERVILTNLMYKPTNGDVVVVVQPSFREGYPLIKRLIAKEGQTISVDYNTGNVSVDGVVLNEPYIYEKIKYTSDIEYPFTVPEGSVFVMGDNRNNSLDSRSYLIGLIETKNIMGHVVFRIFPFNRIGLIR